MEIDFDRLPWDHDLFTHVPQIENGHLVVAERPGWGTEPNEEAMRAHPPRKEGGLVDYGRRSS
jgi:L-alanine-DL-glutamate epimerase-like enolase superfamily enzyme